ncbi:MAG: hypothetical protein AUH42_05565 [Gemmatimonadetes bacterium 13_1_40CM_70_11]|nr:MAG: hypothetical protein AUH42_05565 [Gemmatimonadetes bacterium 13_1_40CM_70_11]
MNSKPHVVYVVNQDWFFLSHRLPVARAARRVGARVTVIAADSGRAEAIRAEGLDFVRLPLSRRGANPVDEVWALSRLLRLYRRLQPDLIHHVTLKPVLYGSLAARLVSHAAVVNAVAGFGYSLTSTELRARLIRPLVKQLCRVALRHPRSQTIFQNPEDRDDFIRMGLVPPAQAVLIRGSGVNCSVFRPTPHPDGDPIVVLASRMLWDKGVPEFVAAAALARTRGVRARFVLVGAPDPGNPRAIPVPRLEAWSREGVVEWWGPRDNMADVLSRASVAVLPTVYGEGIPKVLLEAAASGRPIVATDVRGCREIVRPGVNGILVRPHDRVALANAMTTLVESPELRRRFGQAGRDLAVREFTEELVVSRTLDVYSDLLGERWPR